MNDTSKNTIFNQLIDLQLEPKWYDESKIEFKYNHKFMVLEFDMADENIITVTHCEFFINGNEHYKQIFDHVALKISSRYHFVKIISDQCHYSARYELSLYQIENFADELTYILEKIKSAIHEFFLRLDIIEEDLSVKNSVINQINLN